ncbi:3-methyl-2-oxobutanoate dehydrogenase subunit VorB [Carboxydothermus hydrogenoformans]|uniref:Putative keto/oxoacid ferredoxin oxidoreductase, alpha subunit n=1 Tax=Carboxydothermus hydrogenoformans (strain ATCC BAA-161 / DSM 6008 / Z-2901) TaxID=246194 RepID=Q3ACI9_CARHZ|nr:3-methyl-2-oxobutanoate dehydrogenase subunit VorB [Carboxydothermus hydrogenoformans]ABB13953.1 putative keto/oxoacid ferredoxin oxidoreductase, alpha subunit [Carboxydothermus hydrogenoformans Z-2901]
MGKVLFKGAEAIAEAAIRSGCKFFFGYPITPQTEVAEYMAKRLPQVGGVYLQAESEVSAINMVFGAAATGARVMTSSSSPGVSLKQEGISYIAGAELPCVVVNIMRGGPGLGCIQAAQSDYFQAVKGGGHGDYKNIVLAPSTVQEAVDLVSLAFDLADKYRNPVMILGDAVLAQIMEPIELPEEKKELPEKPWAITGCSNREQNIITSSYPVPEDLEAVNERLNAKYKQIIKEEQRWEEDGVDDAELVFVAYGTSARIAKDAVETLRNKGKKVGLIRPITLWPFPKKAFKNRMAGKKILVVEMSKGQMVEDVEIAVKGQGEIYFYGRTGGIVPYVEEVLEVAEAILNNENVKKWGEDDEN